MSSAIIERAESAVSAAELSLSENSEWNEFVRDCPAGHHEQTTNWGEVRKAFGWDFYPVVVRRENRICAGMQILVRPARKFGNIAYVCKGPLARRWDESLASDLLRQFKISAKRNRILAAIMELPENGEEVVPYLKREGYVPYPHMLPPRMMTATTVVDLNAPEDEILARMSKGTRYNIRLGLKKGITVRPGNAGEIALFFDLMRGLCERRGTTPSPAHKEFFDVLWEKFNPQGGVKLFMAEFGGKVIASALVFPFGQTVRLWKVGWNGENRNLCPNNVLWWEAIRWARNSGYRYFDLVSIDRSIAVAIKNGNELAEEEKYGPAHFKLGFGGSVVLLPGAYCKFYTPILSHGIGNVILRVLGMKRFNQLLNLIWARRSLRRPADE